LSAAASPRPPDTARAAQAPLLYPLFGIGANVGQTLSGKLLSLFSSTASRRLSYAQQLQAIMLVVLGFGALVLALHHHIVHRFDTNVHGSEPPVVVVPPAAAAPPPLPAPSATGAIAGGPRRSRCRRRSPRQARAARPSARRSCHCARRWCSSPSRRRSAAWP